MNNPKFDDARFAMGRRSFLSNSFAGIGSLALANLIGPAAAQAAPTNDGETPWPALSGLPHFAPKAKRIIHLCMAGGPSHLESLDPKPELDRIDGTPFPASFTEGQQLAQLQNRELNARKSFTKFKRWGESGLEMSARQWSAGVLPSKYQGIAFQSSGSPVHYIGNPDGVCQSTQRQVVDEVQRLNGILAKDHFDPEIATRISQYEMAFKMQSAVPELTDMGQESKTTLEAYGVDKPGDGSYASNCLLARRLLERGVRVVQLYHRAWDHHSDIEEARVVKDIIG